MLIAPKHNESSARASRNANEPFFKPRAQAKLKVNQPGDPQEVETDKAADSIVDQNQTVNLLNPSSSQPIQAMEEDKVQAKEEEASASEDQAVAQGEEIQAKEEEEVQAKEEEEVQSKEEEEASASEDQAVAQGEQVQATQEEEVQTKKEEEVQAKLQEAPPMPSQPSIVDKLKQSKGAGQSLNGNAKAKMEGGFGADFGGVKIHTDTRAKEMTSEVGAQAFTHQNDIYFNENKFKPESKEGQKLLAHELTHTIQQGAVEKEKSPDQSAKSDKKEETSAGANASTPETEQEANSSSEATTSSATNSASSSTAPTDAATTELQPVEGETLPGEEVALEGEEEIIEEPSIERDPTANPAFQEVVAGIGQTATKQKEHDPSEELSSDAQAAAPSPANERGSRAQANQVDEMEAQEPQEFSAEGFKAQLMARIAEMQLPKNNEEADEFEDHNNIDEVNKKATGDVQKEKANAAGPIDQSTKKEPNTSAVPERVEEALPPLKEAPKPKSVGATKAIPDKRPDSEVVKPIQEDTARMDQTMAENNVTDEQLAKSEEPTFQEALGKKTEAKATAETAPTNLRGQEDAVLQNNANKAENKSMQEMQGMNMLRGTALKDVGGKQADTSTQDTSERSRIASEINTIYEETKTDVTNILDTLEQTVTDKFAAAAEVAKGKFEDFVDLKMSAYKRRRYGQFGGSVLWLKDKLAGMPDEVNAFFTEGREVFVNHMDGAITVIANIVATELTRAKNRIEIGKQKVTDYVNELPANQKKFGQEAANDIQDKFDSLKDDVNSKQESLVDSLAQQYSDSLAEVDARIEEMKAANKGLIDAALGFINGIIETIKKLRDLVASLLSAIASVIEVIIAAPIEFMGNLFAGIGQGIDMFKANIQKHLLGGLLEWLTGSLGPMGIIVPEDIFSLGGIFNLLMQVLGLGWDYLRLKAVKMMGEPVVNALTSGYDMFITFSTKGVDGIWEYLKESFSDLKETVIEAIKSMLITQVIEAGIKWLLSLLIPGAGFIKAIMAIKDVIVFFVESAIMLIPALIEGILALAAGSVAGVAKAIEVGLGRLLPLVIGLFAKLIGLGGLSKKVMKIFTNIRKRVDKAVTKLLMKAKTAGQKILRKLGIGKKGEKKKKETESEIEESGNIAAEPFTMSGAAHTLSFKNGKVHMASVNPGVLESKLVKAEKKAKETENQNPQTPKIGHIVKSLGGLIRALGSAETKLTAAKSTNDDKKIKKAQNSLRDIALNIGNFGTKNGLTDLAITAFDEAETVSGQLLKPTSIQDKTNLAITEDRAGKQLVGYKAKESTTKNGFDGFIVGEKGSNNAYIKQRKQLNDIPRQFTDLTNMDLHARRNRIGSAAPDHDKFKPVMSGPPIIKGTKTTIRYGYLGDSSASFQVTFDSKNNETEKVTATGLSFHDLGRGITQGQTMGGMDRAHVIGNEIKGSGYITGHNLMLTSSVFNQKTMRDAENRSASYIKSTEIFHGSVESFDMDVTVLRYEQNEKSTTPALRSSLVARKNALQGKVSTMTEERKTTSKTYAEFATLEALLLKSDEAIMNLVSLKAASTKERRIKDVRYLITKIKYTNGKIMNIRKVFNTGPDVYGLED
jgi:Domain of unknown function (DUF4157)